MFKKIKEGLYSVGILNPNLRVFDIVMRTDFGTSYNSYIVKGSEKTALIETCHARFFDQYLENIREVCPLEEIDYIVLNHTEPDHSGVLDKLMQLIPGAQIFASPAAGIYLKNITNNPQLSVTCVKDGETLSLGDKTLSFINAPFLHWPDSMFTYVKEDSALFSCDFFGSHYCEPAVLDTKIAYSDCYFSALENYYTAIFGPFPSFVRKGLEKISGLTIDTVCTSHGPVLTKNGLVEQVLELYKKWSVEHPVSKHIPIFYCSAYGCTKSLAESIQKGILSVKSDHTVELYNIIDHDMAALSDILHSSAAFLIGSPTLNKDAVPPVWMLLSHMDAINIQKKPCATFGSFGWSGEAVPMITERLRSLKLKVFDESFRVNFVPSDTELSDAVAFGKRFAESL